MEESSSEEGDDKKTELPDTVAEEAEIEYEEEVPPLTQEEEETLLKNEREHLRSLGGRLASRPTERVHNPPSFEPITSFDPQFAQRRRSTNRRPHYYASLRENRS